MVMGDLLLLLFFGKIKSFYVDQNGLELVILLPQLAMCWDDQGEGKVAIFIQGKKTQNTEIGRFGSVNLYIPWYHVLQIEAPVKIMFYLRVKKAVSISD